MNTLRERFEAKYKVNPETGCWDWTAYTEKTTGYGKIMSSAPHRKLIAHRVAYELHVGPIQQGLQLDHSCRNRACVNPAHLRPMTQQENKAIGSRPMRTMCDHGHPFTKENTSLHNGYRRCKECHRQERKR